MQWTTNGILNHLFELLGTDHAHLHENRRGVPHADQPDQSSHKPNEPKDHEPQIVAVSLRLALCISIPCRPLPEQCDGPLHPTLLRSEEALGILGHAVGELAVHEVRVLTLKDAVQTAGCVLDLATSVELLTLDQLRPQPVVSVPDTLHAAIPNRVSVAWAMGELPHAVRAAGTHAAATITDHGIQSEELGIVVVEVICLVSILRVVLRSLCEAHPVVQIPILVEETRDARNHKVRLVLVACICDGVQGWGIVLVSFVVVQILWPIVDNRNVIVNKIETASFSVRRPQGNLHADPILVRRGINHFLALFPQLQPLL
mmetsp:Transcript_6507/g.16227  ORF Transcript_6507/g.16227 Transcript_6507/m.16227 type:complete len:316 (-) Transcript_6507:2650-3597(-)